MVWLSGFSGFVAAGVLAADRQGEHHRYKMRSRRWRSNPCLAETRPQRWRVAPRRRQTPHPRICLGECSRTRSRWLVVRPRPPPRSRGKDGSSPRDEHEDDRVHRLPMNTEDACAMKERRKEPPDKERRRHQKQSQGFASCVGGRMSRRGAAICNTICGNVVFPGHRRHRRS